MAVTQYIGARYVPLFAEPSEWDSTRAYEPLTIVIHQGNSYTSRQAVPIGIDITNNSFWALTGNYNAQVESYRREVATYSDRIDAAKDTADEALGNTATLETSLANETTARQAADTALRTALETQLQEAVTNLETDINNVSNALYFRPEDYGAVGDGATDDRAAIQAAIDAAVASGNRAVVVFTANSYLITDGLYVNGHVMFTSLASRLQTPRIIADFEGENKAIITVNAAQFAMYGIVLRAQYIVDEKTHEAIVDRRYKVDGINYANTPTDVDTVIHSSKFMLLRDGMKTYGRSVIVKNTHFSGCSNGIVFHNTETDDDSARGYIVTDCRFHSVVNHGIVFDFDYPYYQNSVYIANNYIDRGSSTTAFIYGDLVTGYITNNEMSISCDKFVELTANLNKDVFQGESLVISNNMLMFRNSSNVTSAIKISGITGLKAYRVVVNNNVVSNIDGCIVDISSTEQVVVKDNIIVITSLSKPYSIVKATSCSNVSVYNNGTNYHGNSDRQCTYIVDASDCNRIFIYDNQLEYKKACNQVYYPRNPNSYAGFATLALAAGDFVDDAYFSNADQITARIQGQQNITFQRHTSGDFYAQTVMINPTLAYGGKINVSNDGRLTVVEMYTFDPTTGNKINETLQLTSIVAVR